MLSTCLALCAYCGQGARRRVSSCWGLFRGAALTSRRRAGFDRGRAFCDFPAVAEGCDGAFTVDSSRITFGRGCLAELGERAAALGMRRVVLFSDPAVAELAVFTRA